MTGPVGIDLGTTNSVVAYVDANGVPEVIPDDDGQRLVPSVVSFAGAAPVVGAAAKAEQADGEAEVAAAFKRSMGDPAFLLCFGGEDYDATRLSALVLAHLAAQAERFLEGRGRRDNFPPTPPGAGLGPPGKQAAEAVVTVPAYFTHPQRAATIAAGQAAGLDVMKIISEPTAAALAYGLRPGAGGRRILVYDLGGGTFDVSLVEITPDGLEVIGVDGDHHLGGRDWDDRLAVHLGRCFARECGVEVAADDAAALLARAETLKHTLSARQSAEVRISSAGRTARCTVTKPEFETMTRDLLDRTMQITHQVLADTGSAWEQVDGVIPVGGSTRMPMVGECIRAMSGRPPLGGVHPDHAVALGAALEAKAESERRKGRSPAAAALDSRRLPPPRALRDVTAHSLGMIAESEDRTRYLNSILIAKNLPIPARQTRPYQFRIRGGSGSGAEDRLEVFLTQGETEDPQECTYLGRYVVTGFGGAPGPAVVDIAYSYDQNGIVHVSAGERATGRPLAVAVGDVGPDVPECFLAPPPELAGREHATVYLAFDISGSMGGRPIDEARRAAETFVSQCDLTTTSVGLISFSDALAVEQEATQNSNAITAAIGRLRVGATGYGNAGHPFDTLYDLLHDASGGRYAIVLADGVWEKQDYVIGRARRCHAEGIEVVAIGFGQADRRFLECIASSSQQSLFTNLNRLADAFSTIAQELTEGGPARVGSRALRFRA